MEQQNQKPQQNTQNQPPLSSSKKGIFKSEIKIFLIVAAVATILAVAGIFLFLSWRLGTNPITYAQCSQLGQEMDTLIKQANYCEVDSDCIVISEVAPRCFGLVNKDADITSIQRNSLQWQNLGCGKGSVSEQCVRAPNVLKCQENRCVGVWNQDNPVIDTSTWQTYRNDEFGFEVRYPKGWVMVGEGEIKNQQTNSSLSIIENNNPKNLSLDEWFREATLINGRPTIKAVAKPVTINGVRAYRLDTELPPPNPYFEIVGIADEQQHIFTIHADYKVLEDGEILNQILSTFRFIE